MKLAATSAAIAMCLASTAAAGPAAPTGPSVSGDPFAINLDGDPQPEQLVYNERPSDLAVQAQLIDHCDGAPQTFRLSPYLQKFTDIRAVEVDGDTSRPEIFLQGVGIGPSLGDRFVALLRYDDRTPGSSEGGCQPPRTLLRYGPLRDLGKTQRTFIARLRGRQLVLVRYDLRAHRLVSRRTLSYGYDAATQRLRRLR